MELNIDSLIIEVTRKCNMQCEHCLRGAAQRKTIDDNHKILLDITESEEMMKLFKKHRVKKIS